MSQSFVSPLPDLVIANGATASNVISRNEYADAVSIAIQAPATLAETVTIQVSYDNSTWATLHDGTADIASPLAGKARQYIEMFGFNYFRLLAGSAVGAARTFKVGKQWVA